MEQTLNTTLKIVMGFSTLAWLVIPATMTSGVNTRSHDSQGNHTLLVRDGQDFVAVPELTCGVVKVRRHLSITCVGSRPVTWHRRQLRPGLVSDVSHQTLNNSCLHGDIEARVSGSPSLVSKTPASIAIKYDAQKSEVKIIKPGLYTCVLLGRSPRLYLTVTALGTEEDPDQGQRDEGVAGYRQQPTAISDWSLWLDTNTRLVSLNNSIGTLAHGDFHPNLSVSDVIVNQKATQNSARFSEIETSTPSYWTGAAHSRQEVEAESESQLAVVNIVIIVIIVVGAAGCVIAFLTQRRRMRRRKKGRRKGHSLKSVTWKTRDRESAVLVTDAQLHHAHASNAWRPTQTTLGQTSASETITPQTQGQLTQSSDVREQISCWEFPLKRLSLREPLGQGMFGQVLQAEATGIDGQRGAVPVAVKMVKDTSNKDQRNALKSELQILIHLGKHLNILSLLGTVSQGLEPGQLYVIVEFCRFGNLRDVLLSHRDKSTLSARAHNHREIFTERSYVPHSGLLPFVQQTRSSPCCSESHVTRRRDIDDQRLPDSNVYINDVAIQRGSDTSRTQEHAVSTTNVMLLSWAFQVAKGMDYLANKKYIHRDLAARNVLLADNNVVKICDFGLSRDLLENYEYVKTGQGLLPVKWMALESISHGLFSTKSDVWSFGVFLWELFTLGGIPYPGVDMRASFLDLLKTGHRLERPDLAGDEIYQVMLSTWEVEPESRPSFSQLVQVVGDLLEADAGQDYVGMLCPSVSYTTLGAESPAEMLRADSEDLCAYLVPRPTPMATV